MPAQIITVAELVEYGSRSIPMDGFASAVLLDKINQATDRIRQAALNDYTPESFELITPANVPDDLREIALAVALHILTRADAGRPASIDATYDDVSRRIGFIAGGTTNYHKSPNSVLVKIDGGGTAVKSSTSTRVFDRTDAFGDYSRHSTKLS